MREPRLKQDILNRLKSIEGHVRGIQRMVEEDQYCIDILNQTSAVHKALEKIDVMILENHLETCVTTAIRGDDPRERERVLRELVSLFQSGQTSGLPHPGAEAGGPGGGRRRGMLLTGEREKDRFPWSAIHKLSDEKRQLWR